LRKDLPSTGSRKPEAGSCKNNHLTAKSPRVLFNRLAFLVLFAGLLGLSAQLRATTACVGVDDDPQHCRDVPDYDPGFSQDGNTGSTGMPGPGDTGGSDPFGGGTNFGNDWRGGDSSEDATDTNGQAECSDEPSLRRSSASQVVRANIVLQCAITQMAHAGYWRVEFEGNTSGIYRGTGNSCRDTVFLEEIEPPDCY